MKRQGLDFFRDPRRNYPDLAGVFSVRHVCQELTECDRWPPWKNSGFPPQNICNFNTNVNLIRVRKINIIIIISMSKQGGVDIGGSRKLFFIYSVYIFGVNLHLQIMKIYDLQNK